MMDTVTVTAMLYRFCQAFDLSGVPQPKIPPTHSPPVIDQQPDGSHSGPPEVDTSSQSDDDALLEVRISIALPRRFTDDDDRSSCPRAHLPHYSITMRYVVIKSLVPRVNNTLKPPSPESRENPLESGAPAPGTSPAKPHSSPGPPIIPCVEMPDRKPTPDNPASSEWNRRSVLGWFRKVMTKRSHHQTAHQTPSEVPSQSGIASQTKATPPNEKPSTMSPGKRQAVSVPLFR